MISRLTTILRISFWTLATMIFIIVILGGATRLTGSGLSMVEWNPLTFSPPMGKDQWLAEFSRYQTSPEFIKVHPDMTLAEFQSIFWLEYVHRLWGRLLGIVLLIPTAIVLLSRSFSHLRNKVLLLWVLGGAQGVLGWYMVKSGLIDAPHVSPYRLAAHLLMGFAIFAVAIKSSLSVTPEKAFLSQQQTQLKTIANRGHVAILLVLTTVCVGAFVAGLKAGLIYNTFPLMGDRLIPEEIFFYTPFWVNLTENAATVQLLHRIFATLTLAYVLWFAYSSYHPQLPRAIKSSSLFLVCTVITQYLLGVLTLLYQVPVSLGVIHQGIALFLFGVLVYMTHKASIMKLS